MPIVLVAALAVPALAAGEARAASTAPDRVIVAFERDATAGERRDARADVDGRVVDTIVPRVQVLTVPDGTARSAAAELSGDDHVVRWAQADVLQQAQWTPNDPSFPSQWAWENTGQYAGTPGVDVDAPQAWELARGDGVLVGVVDSGVSFIHADSGALRANPGEIAANGQDDDGNGLVDDVRGWDFTDSDNDPSDGTGHGTAVGSIVNAASDNRTGMAGIAPGASVVHARVLDTSGRGYASTVAAGMDYVATQGAKIVNVSIGGGSSRAEREVLAKHPGVLFVVSAGNSSMDNDVPAEAMYPCAEPAPNVLCVGATTNTDDLASFSNWGSTTVDLMAPGATVHGLSWRYGNVTVWDGTSFSAPLTAGVAALLRSHDPSASAARLKAAILSSAVPVAGLAGRSVTGGRLNAATALAALDDPSSAPTVAVTPSAAGAPAPAPAPVADPAPVTVPVGDGAPKVAVRSRPTRTPSISGAARVGRRVRGRVGAWSGPGVRLQRQWLACDARGRRCVRIRGQRSSTLKITRRLAGRRIRLRVTAFNAAGAAVAVSAATRRVRR